MIINPAPPVVPFLLPPPPGPDFSLLDKPPCPMKAIWTVKDVYEIDSF